MGNVTGLVCVACGAGFNEGEACWCPRCGLDGGILDVEFELGAAARTLTREALAARAPNQWRYAELLPVGPDASALLPDIGWTPLLDAPRLAAALGVARLRLKDDGRSASGSSKDRASAVGVVRAIEQGFGEIACASTGNAASSLARNAAATGLKANIFVSARIPDGKLAQLLAFGARVFRVNGTYDEAWHLCNVACRRFGWYNRNCAINPYLVEGKKTVGMEIAEQCASDPPDWVAASVGDGCSIAGLHKGLRQMAEVGVVEWHTRVLGVQAAGVSPIARAFDKGSFEAGAEGDTYADSIHCPVPRNWRKALNAVRESGGAYVTATDDGIREAVRVTGRLAGVFAEPAAAAAVAGVLEARRQGIIGSGESVVAVVSGNGLKDIAGAMAAVGAPHDIAPDITAVERVVQPRE